ncbi:hypothetical protein NB689_003402 [Xanthomonas sacchari]|nr:hypothetical protein [Xanthomonas sacchari]
MLGVAAGQFGDQGGLGVAAGQLQVAGALAAHVPLQLHLAFGGRAQRRLDQLGVGNLAVQQHLARRRVLDVVLRHERTQHLGGTVLAVGLGEERAGAEVAAVAERQQQHAGVGALGGAGQHVEVGGTAVHVLPALHAAQRAQQIAQARGAFELQTFAGGLHRLHQFLAELVAAPFQEQRGAAHRLGVLVGRHQRHARRAATADLVLQARPRTIAEHAVLAAAQLEQLVHQVQRLAHRGDAGIRPEIAPGHRARATVQGDPRPLLAGQQHVGIALVVAQRHVVARRQRLDQLVFQQQRLALAAGDGDIHARHLRQHGHGPRILRRAAEIAGHALAQRAGLSDVEQGVVGGVHAVDAGRGTEVGGKGLAVERG